MSGLLDEYFKRDLAEAEEDELARWLSSSEEGAQRFIGLMETHYRSLGLADSDWVEGPLPKFFPKSRSKPLWLLILVFFAFLLTLLAYNRHIWKADTRLSPAPTSTAGSETATEKTSPMPTNKQAPKVSTAASKPKGKVHEELSVVVDNPHAGLVTVKVMDQEGVEVRLLFAGILPAGQKTFIWDGKGGKGTVSQPGVYYLEVASGAHQLRKEIHLGSTP